MADPSVSVSARAEGDSGGPSMTAARATLPWLLLPALVVCLTGCPRPPPGFGPEPYEEAEAVLAVAREQRFVPAALIADARLRVDGPAGRGAADHFVVLRAPSDLRLETLSFFGNPLALISVVDDDFLLWEIEANRAWEGGATAENLAALLPVSLPPEEIVALLLGSPDLSGVEEQRLDLDHENRRYVVSQLRGEVWQQVIVRPEDELVEELRWYGVDGELLARVFYDRYREVAEGKLFPYEMRYEGEEGVSLEVSYREVTFNPEPSELERLFSVRLPEHVRIISLDPAQPPPPMMPAQEKDQQEEDPEE
ncbi:MAG: DUF4292 domain-containing protein [Myxococcota bacterium]